MKFARRHCPRCARITRQEVSCCVSASGAEHFGWWCLECRAWAPARHGGSWIAKETLIAHGVDLLSVPVVDAKKGERCAHCGKRGAEEHHWAPRAIFGREVADTWPTDFLCKPCHDEWHRKVTPQLIKTGL